MPVASEPRKYAAPTSRNHQSQNVTLKCPLVILTERRSPLFRPAGADQMKMFLWHFSRSAS
jgi:hypothetical protein